VDIDSDLKYDTHIDNIVKKAYQRIALIFRGFASRKPELLVKAYVSFVRPVLEYCSCIWSPVLITRINTLERVQKYFTKRLYGMEDLNYTDRLSIINIESLEMRRLKLDIYLYYKILHNIVALPADVYFRYDDRHLNVRSYDENNLVKPLLNTVRKSQHFFNRCIDVWNFIPVAIRNCDSLSVFKRAVADIDFSCFMTGTVSL